MDISKSQARQLVKDIAKGHGHLDEAVYKEMTASARCKVEEALLMKDKLIGSTVVTLAKNLYSKDVRFIFELLQNADDNQFGRAGSASQDPYVSFRVYHDKIVVECNEDGFTKLNLTAICNVGKSSKLGAQGYIGEKGIGFKSVFKVASKVWIQSGSFSFCFKHRRGDSGMGMISPEWEETTEELAGPLTRMTFYLSDDGDPVVRAEQRKNINNQLNDLRPEMLLFLKKLRRIEVHLHNDTGDRTSSSVLSKLNVSDEPNRAVLQTVKTENGQAPRNERQYYHVTQTKASGLEPNENRDHTAEEHARKAYSTADIILAFPLTAQSLPVIKSQELFAFLPIRRVGFNFLIHSDFVTMANREDIVTSSLRNRGICRQLAAAFITAVQQMCEDTQLKFKWMAYLPSVSGSPSDDPFWSLFVNELKDSIAGAASMVPWAQPSKLRPINQLKQLSDQVLDRHGDPLFDDLKGQAATDISKSYSLADLSVLREGYGLQVIHWNDIIKRVWADLQSNPSRVRSPDTDNDWHSRASKLLLVPFRDSAAKWLIPKVKALTLVPLSNGHWVNTVNIPVYFPTTVEGYFVPRGLGLQLIDAQAVSHPSRRELFVALGATVPTAGDIRALILKRFGPQGNVGFGSQFSTDLISKETSIAFLRFLYLTHPKNGRADTYQHVELLSTSMESVNPFRIDMYFKDDTTSYGPAKLNLPVKYVHPDYLVDPPTRNGEHSPVNETMRQWLHHSLGVRKRLRLATKGPDGKFVPTAWIRHVCENAPDKFLGLIHSLWKHEAAEVTSSEEIRSWLRSTKVLCEGGSMQCLQDTILPLPHLKSLSAQYLRQDEVVPFLKLETTLVDTNLAGWEFLDSSLGVIRSEGIALFLKLLEAIRWEGKKPLQDPSRLLDLYAAIYAQCTASSDKKEAQRLTRVCFGTNSPIFIPQCKGKETQWWVDDKENWCYPANCLLDAPSDMSSKFPVEAIYRATFPEVASLNSSLLLMRDVLDVDRYSWRSALDEVSRMKDYEEDNIETVREKYRRLSKFKVGPDDIKAIRQRFTEERLLYVYVSDDRVDEEWHEPGYCIWSATASSLSGRPNLAKQCPQLEDFFVKTLGVEKLNLGMLYDELLAIKRWTTVDEIKEHLRTFNSLIEVGTLGEAQTPARILEKSILPVRYPDGQVQLRPGLTEFVILDHKSLGEKFGNRVKTLDFSDREVRSLKPFLAWAGLEDRYISRAVKETATLGSEAKWRVSERRYDISKKAHGLLRIATHFNSPRLSGNGQAFYDLLRNSESWETDGITAQLTITMDGEHVTVNLEHGDVYIDEKLGTPLKIYIPHDEGKQDECIQSTLPRMLVQWFMTNPGTQAAPVVNQAAIGFVTGLLNARLASVKGILEKGGITEVDIPDTESEEDEVRGVLFTQAASAPLASARAASARLASTAVTVVPAPRTPPRSHSSSSSSSSVTVFTPAEPNYRNSYLGQETPLTDPFVGLSPNRLPGGYFSRPQPVPEPRTPESRSLYCKLLDHVVQAGRRLQFPSHGAFDMSPLQAALPFRNVASDAQAQSFASARFTTFEIGAAGELFVFELLSRLDPSLPGFSRGNWTSGIRTLVNAHQDYESLAAWGGRYETSDLEYDDEDGVFTSLLIEKGFLASDEWEERTPKYHFEVKSTPQELGAPFFMSGSQYGKMKALSDAEDTVYVIFRVFRLYGDEIDVRLYVNPPKLEREGELEFAAEKYSVRVVM